MTPTDIIQSARKAFPDLPPEATLAQVGFLLPAEPPEEETDDLNAQTRWAVYEKLFENLDPGDLPLLRFLMEQETLNFSQDLGMSDEIKLCAYLLHCLGTAQDSLLIWKAKNASFDTMCGLDVQLVAVTGYDNAILWLRQSKDPEADFAVEYLEGCLHAGDFKHFERSIAQVKDYFERD